MSWGPSMLILKGQTDMDRIDDIAASIATIVMEDLAEHFLLRQRTWCKDWGKLAMVIQGSVVRSQTNYILVSNCQIFQNVAARDLRHNSDHLMVIR